MPIQPATRPVRAARRCLLFVSVAALSACAPAPVRQVPLAAKPYAAPAPAGYVGPCAEPGLSAFDCDRRSILAMAGEFRVHFAFDETAALAPGYVPHLPNRSGGSEVVLVIADSGRHISLQHILVLGEKHTVVKHWRQDWDYQPSLLLRFRGNGRFERESTTADAVQGQWSQTVYEVDDAPRYAGIGRWSHQGGVDAWESDRTWRPLPRREYTTRSDYQALAVVNRHTLTPAGWVQEQDNTKLVLDAEGRVQAALVREHGVNSYERIGHYDFAAGRDYWKATAGFWTQVREEWQRGFAAHPAFVLRPDPNGAERIDALFALAERAGRGETIERGAIDAILTRYGLAVP